MDTRNSARAWLKVGPAAALALLAACAVGNRYDYSKSINGLPVSGTGRIAVEVVDARPYVLNHEKKADFTGLQRGGFGNPFDVTTASGRPLAEDMHAAITKALMQQGFTPVDATDAAPRRLELRVNEWKTDVMMRFTVDYDLVLNVLDAQHALLATSATKGSDTQGGGFESQNSTTAARQFELRFTELVRNEAVHKALAGTP